MSSFLYALLCLILPLVWGILTARVFDRLESRRRADALPAREDDSVVMYEI